MLAFPNKAAAAVLLSFARIGEHTTEHRAAPRRVVLRDILYAIE
jgi:hypothetical protein